MQTKITLVMILVAVIPAFLLGRYALKYQDEVVRSNLRIHEGFSSVMKSEITRRIWGYRKLLTNISQMPAIQRMDPAEIQEVLSRILQEDEQKDRGLGGLAVYGRNKQLVASHGKVPKVTRQETLFSDVFFDTYGGNSTPVVAAQVDGPQPEYVESSQEGTQTQLEFVVYSPTGEIVGAIVASLSPDYLSWSINRVMGEIAEASSRADIYVLDASDHVIAASRNAKYVGQPVLISTILEKSDEEMANRVEVPLGAFYTPDWRLMIVPRPQAWESVQKIRTTTRRTILAALMAAIAFGLFLTRTITNPLSKLVQSALKISQGDLSTPVEIASRDEIGDLSATFEMMRINLARMQENLKDRIEELATLYDVGKAIGSTLNMNELLHLVLDMVMKLVKADRGSIMLFDEESQELRIAVSKNLPPGVPEKTRVKIGENVSGYVLETGKPLLIPDSEKSPSFLKLKETEVHSGCMLAVPLITKDKKLGVLNIAKSIPYSLGERDLEFFKALTNQASIAIENAKLYEMAIKDELTKLYIRRYFDQRLKEELRRAKRYKGPLTLMLLDIDHFKSFNDRYGHRSGDEVLCFLARVMEECVRNVDIVSRHGGEEFAILCPEQSTKDAHLPAERIRKKVESSLLTLAGHEVRCTVSIGLASFPGDGKTPEDLMEHADQALYHAKHSGRNLVCLYADMRKSGKVPDPEAKPPRREKKKSDE